MKLRFIVLFLLVLSCMLVTSVSYAWTIDDFFHYTNIVHNTSGISDKLYYGTQKVLDNETGIRNIFNQHSTNITTITCGVVGSNNYIEIYLDYAGNLNINSSRAILNTNVGAIKVDNQNGGNPRWSNGSANLQAYSNNCFGLVDSSQTIPSQYFINNYWVPPYTGPVFTPANNGNITVYNSVGASQNLIRLPYYPNGQNDYLLGYLSDYDSVYAINGYFGPFTQSDSNGNIIDLSRYGFNYSDYFGTYQNGISFDYSTGAIRVSKNSLLNKQGYELYLTYQENYGDDTTSDITESFYYSYYGNLNISSGDVISNDLPDYTEINGFINGFGDFTSYNSGDSDNGKFLIGQFMGFSGDPDGLNSMFGKFYDFDQNERLRYFWFFL